MVQADMCGSTLQATSKRSKFMSAPAALLALSAVRGYHGYALLAWLYGGCLGGFLYSLKMLALERVRPRHFSRAWALVQAGQALPVLLGAPLAVEAADAQSSRDAAGSPRECCTRRAQGIRGL
ncbi:uncharacterized protein GBIM_01802 [Gryllus bimaculatus]|nr:uncharacterized protein GBIM_01802 [Gryllus bimaculatus]